MRTIEGIRHIVASAVIQIRRHCGNSQVPKSLTSLFSSWASHMSFLFCCFRDRLSGSPGWPWTCYLAEDDLEFLIIPASTGAVITGVPHHVCALHVLIFPTPPAPLFLRTLLVLWDGCHWRETTLLGQEHPWSHVQTRGQKPGGVDSTPVSFFSLMVHLPNVSWTWRQRKVYCLSLGK